MADVSHSQPIDPADDRPYTAPTTYAWYVTFVLMLAYTLSYIDRKMPFILVESIKADLNLSDSQIGLLTGAVFAVIYAFAGFPLALLTDRRSRKHLIAWAIAAWSALTALGGFATNFLTLAITRAGVAAGEAACTPASHSIIADYVPGPHRGRAIGIYLIGAPLGALLGLALGGWINQIANWRVAMFALGAPGILLALLIFLTVKEPPRQADHHASTGEAAPTVREAFTTIFNQPALVFLLGGMTLSGMSTTALQAFAPAYIIRNWHLETGTVGVSYGVAFGVAGVVGIMIGSILGDRFHQSAPGRVMLLCAAALAAGAVAMLWALFSSQYMFFLVGILAFQVGYNIIGSPSFVTIQTMVSSRMYGVATATALFGVSGIGLSVGPLVTGMISDSFSDLGAAHALRIALMAMVIPHVLAALLYILTALALHKAVNRAPRHG